MVIWRDVYDVIRDYDVDVRSNDVFMVHEGTQYWGIAEIR